MTIPIDAAAIAASPLARLRFLEDFVGFTDEDRAALRESLLHLGPRLPRILDALYDHLLSFEDTRRIFLGRGDRIDAHYLMVRKEHLTEWLLRVAASLPDESLGDYLVKVAHAHTGVNGDPGRIVPPRYLVAVTARLQAAFLLAIHETVSDSGLAVRFGVAWTKILAIQLELFLKTVAPLWPRWDEPHVEAPHVARTAS